MDSNNVTRMENEPEECAASLISKPYIMSILKTTYDAVFFFDVLNDILICQHIMEPLLSDVFNVRMVLRDAIRYWIDNLVDEEDKAAATVFVKQNVYRESSFGTVLTFNFGAHTKNGHEKYYYTSTLCALSERTYLFCCKDITEYKTTSMLSQRNRELEKLANETEKYRLAFDFLKVAVLEWDFINDSFSVSPGYSRYALSKYEPSLVSQNLEDLSGIHNEDLPRFVAFCQELSCDKSSIETTVRMRTLEGDYRWTNITIILYWDSAGKIEKAIGILYDVDELVQTQVALSQSQEQLELIVNNILEGIIIFEVNGVKPKIQYMSDKALRFYGIDKDYYQEEISLGKTPDEIVTTRLLSKDDLMTLISQGRAHFSRVLPGSSSMRHFEVICSLETNINFPLYYAIIRETTQEHEARARIEWQQEKYRMICQGSDIVTFDYNVCADELVYSFNLPPHGYQEKTMKSFLADIELVTLFREAQLHEFKNYIHRILNGEEVDEFEILLNLHRHGFEWYSMQLFGVKDEMGKVYRVIGKTQSIQKAKDHLREQLRSQAVIQIALSSDALFSAAFNVETGEKVSITGEVIPEAIKPVTNISQIFAHLKENVHPDDMELLLTHIFEMNLLSPNETARKQKFEFRFHTLGSAPGEYIWVQFTYMYAFNDVINSYVLYFFVMDIDEEKKQMLHIIEKANLDTTTHFLNRAAFERYCECERSNTKLSRTLNALIVIEFKFEDDSPGYESIQRIERTAKVLADSIQTWARKEDRLARFSDTKLLICMHSLDSRADLHERAESLRGVLNHFEHESIGISVFMGVTNCCHDQENGYRAAYDQAEIALFHAKENGESQSVFYLDKEGQHTEIIKQRKAYIRTFGFFDVFVDQKPIFFKTAKAKELLAILVDRRGGYLSTDEAISYLWEDEPASKVTRTRYRKVALRLKETLEEHGIGDIIEVANHRRRIVMENVQCDLFDFVSGKTGGTSVFSGNYMSNYSWAEASSAQLNKQNWSF